EVRATAAATPALSSTAAAGWQTTFPGSSTLHPAGSHWVEALVSVTEVAPAAAAAAVPHDRASSDRSTHWNRDCASSHIQVRRAAPMAALSALYPATSPVMPTAAATPAM